MQPPQLLVFTQSRPFEPFHIFASDGRRVLVQHPEMVLVNKFAQTLWLFHSQGQIEVFDTDHITGLKTIDAVNPDQFAGSQLKEV
jgi:hypothetical protein